MWYNILMFDNQNQQPTQQGATNQNEQDASQHSSASQTGQYDEQNKSKSQGRVEDIFADTDASSPAQQAPGSYFQNSLSGQNLNQENKSALSQGKIYPSQNSGVRGVPQEQVSGRKKPPFPIKNFLFVILMFLIFFGIAFGGYIIWKNNLLKDTFLLDKKENQEQPNSQSDQNFANENIDNAKTQNSEENEKQEESAKQAEQEEEIEQGADSKLKDFQQGQIDKAIDPIPVDPSSKDTDQDGLSDAEELELGTNLRLVDSDSDGLSDWEEVSIFGTDPLNPDTDGDSYLDGEEVQNGYNPLGSGKLLNIEEAE